MPLDPLTGQDLGAVGEIDPYEYGQYRAHPIEPAPTPPPSSPPPSPAPEIPRTLEAARPPAVTWIFIRNANSLPGNHPGYDDLRARGVTGVLVEANDPYAATVAETAHTAGFHFGIWSDPHGQDGAAYGRDLVLKAHQLGAELVAPDPESTGKGYPGSAQWDWHQKAADAIRAADNTIPIAVLPTPNQDDFNYGAWVGAGAVVWVQTYGEKLSETYPVEATRDRVIANGVPSDRVTVILPAGSLTDMANDARSLGLPYWAIWTVEDVTEADRATPFGEPGTEAATFPPLSLSPEEAVLPEPLTSPFGGTLPPEQDLSDEELGAAGDPDFVFPWEPEEGAIDPELLAILEAEPESANGGRAFQAHRGTPGGAIHHTMNLCWGAIDFFGRPGWWVLAPERSRVVKLSGHPPTAGAVLGPGGPFGWSIYLLGLVTGTSYYITHLGSRLVGLGQQVVVGEVIGTLGDYPGAVPDHIHVAVNGKGTVSVDDLRAVEWFQHRTGAVPTETVIAPTRERAPNTEDVGQQYRRIAQFLNSGAEQRRQTLLGTKKEAMKAVR